MTDEQRTKVSNYIDQNLITFMSRGAIHGSADYIRELGDKINFSDMEEISSMFFDAFKNILSHVDSEKVDTSIATAATSILIDSFEKSIQKSQQEKDQLN